MGTQGFVRDGIPATGIPALDDDYAQMVDLVGELMDASDTPAACAQSMLLRLASLTERHANRIERLLQRADSDALRTARRGHEALLLHLENLQELTGDLRQYATQLPRVCGYLVTVLVQDAAAVRTCMGRGRVAVH